MTIETTAEGTRRAAEAAGVEVQEIHDVDGMEQVDLLLGAAWGERQDAVSVNMMKALAHAGHYVAGARRGGELVGAAVAFAWGPGSAPPPGEPARLHSHVAGVTPRAQGTGVGLALKLHQAGWALERGIDQVTWTFDPLVRRNGWFNLMKLGARAEGYHPDFYGQMRDGINRGEMSDRCIVVWDLAGKRHEAAAPDKVLLEEGPNGRPVIGPAVTTVTGDGGDTVLCQVPTDIVALRRDDPALGREWRLALRETMGGAMQDGYVATAMTKEGHYVLEKRSRL